MYVDCRFRLKIKFCLSCNLTCRNRCHESDINVNDIEKKDNVSISKLIIGTKAKHLVWSSNFFFCKQIVSVLAEKFWDESKQFDLVWISSFRSRILFQKWTKSANESFRSWKSVKNQTRHMDRIKMPGLRPLQSWPNLKTNNVRPPPVRDRSWI